MLVMWDLESLLERPWETLSALLWKQSWQWRSDALYAYRSGTPER
jgi:hypothetical protein